ncbi:MAG: hypothetical protein OEW52_06355 [Thermoleophilia bacterium]|nr:hypothetical protein [Thermoleophilia bacterium]MDH5280759.1 hypothetical protein [Thermoleophilia bacterium]
MSGDGLASATRFLVLALSILYALAAVAGFALLDFDATRGTVLWAALLTGGAALMFVGQVATPAGWFSAVLVSLGAALGALPLFWTLIVPIAVAAVIACSIALARNQAATPA